MSSTETTGVIEPTARRPDVAPIDAGTVLGAVHLTVRDLARSSQFYEQLLGLVRLPAPVPADPTGGPGGAAAIRLAATADGPPLLVLYGGATVPLDRRRPGLYHFALLLPTRRALAAALVRLASAGWPLDGASDHLVSEALYLSDPDGLGIEIYRDRPASEWPHDRAGGVQMATLPLDLDDLLGELGDDPIDPVRDRVAPAGTTIGHVHLQVSSLADSERFYAGILGFDVTQRNYPGALFVAAGGYHHHIGLNVWHSRGAAPLGEGAAAGGTGTSGPSSLAAAAPLAVGLRGFELRLPDTGALADTLARVRLAGLPLLDAVAGGLSVTPDPAPAPGITPTAPAGQLVHDPSGNAILLRH